MKVVIQRVNQASVSVNKEIIGEISKGFLLFVGVQNGDQEEDACYLAKKIAKLRIFEDESGKMNRSILEMNGAILSVSQFTLHAATKKGNRPSFMEAARPDEAERLYSFFNQQLINLGIQVSIGKFGAHMKVSLVNDGPVTIIIDTKE